MSTNMHNNQNNHVKGRFAVDELRHQVDLLFAQCKTELEIAPLLGIDQGTISRDIKTLKEMSRQFVFDLAKSDLAFYYRQCIDGIECVLNRTLKQSSIGRPAN